MTILKPFLLWSSSIKIDVMTIKEVIKMVNERTISQIADLWKKDKKQFVKKSTYAAYSLIVDIHILPAFGGLTAVGEKEVQDFVLHKLESRL